jgi:putative nucleotidyltransferase-like protein
VIRSTEPFESILGAMRKGAGALKEANVPFLLGGGLACWARGGPPTDHDVDFLVRPENAEAGLEALARAGMETERPPEHWLYKAYDDGILVDLIFEPSGLRVDDEVFARAEELEVRAVRMPVASLDDVVTTKLTALSEQDLDYRSVLEIARTLREQIDWTWVREQTARSPYAKAFFTLVEELGIVEPVAYRPSRAARSR